MSEYDWHPVVMLRWSTEGKLQQHWKRRVSNKRGIWYDEFEWRDVPRQPVDEIQLIKYPAQETRSATCPHCDALFPTTDAAGIHSLHCKAT